MERDLRLSRKPQMLGTAITARLCACRYGGDDADGVLSTACAYFAAEHSKYLENSAVNSPMP